MSTDVGIILDYASSTFNIKSITTVIRTLRILRVLRLIKKAKTLKVLIDTLLFVMPGLMNVLLL